MTLRQRAWQERDVLIAGVLAVGMLVEVALWDGAALALTAPCVLLATIPLVGRRRQPVVAFLLVWVGQLLLVQVAPRFDAYSITFIMVFFVSLYSLGAWTRGREVPLAAVLVAIGVVVFAITDGDEFHWGDVVFALFFVGGPWAAGLAIRLRQERVVLLDTENRRLTAEQEEHARRAVAEERSRIARELHDVVSHAIAVTVLQARGARATLGQDDQAVRRALDAIEQTNTAALGDMRRLLAVLRDTEPGAAPDPHAPQPSLAGLDRLIDQVRSSGLPVTLEVSGTPGEVPPGVDLSAYRIVQEALTNALRHAGPATATVRLTYDDDALTVAISDDGAGPAPDAWGRRGHGLIGIRERVAVVGGEVETGPLPGGGFGLTARLPYALELA